MLHVRQDIKSVRGCGRWMEEKGRKSGERERMGGDEGGRWSERSAQMAKRAIFVDRSSTLAPRPTSHPAQRRSDSRPPCSLASCSPATGSPGTRAVRVHRARDPWILGTTRCRLSFRGIAYLDYKAQLGSTEPLTHSGLLARNDAALDDHRRGLAACTARSPSGAVGL